MVLFKDDENDEKNIYRSTNICFSVYFIDLPARMFAKSKIYCPTRKDLECISRLKTTENWVLKRLRLSLLNKKRLSTSIILLTFWLRNFWGKKEKTRIAIIFGMLLIGKWYQELHLIFPEYCNKKIHVLMFVLLQFSQNPPAVNETHERKTLWIISMNTHNFVVLRVWFSYETSTLKRRRR